MAFLEFEFDLYAWVFFEFVDVPQRYSICMVYGALFGLFYNSYGMFFAAIRRVWLPRLWH